MKLEFFFLPIGTVAIQMDSDIFCFSSIHICPGVVSSGFVTKLKETFKVRRDQFCFSDVIIQS